MTVTSDAEFLVRVRAQVMMRDDSTGGWVPLGGGGLSWVAVKKRALEVIHQEHQQSSLPQETRKSPQPPTSNSESNRELRGQEILTHRELRGEERSSHRELRGEERPSNRELRAEERSSHRELRGEERPSNRELRGDERSSNKELRGDVRSSSREEDQLECSCHYEYLIIGRRISDDHDVLSCTIKRDFEYNRVMPTFHHWRTGNKKFGLTFQTAADARTFDKGITAALHDLLNDTATEKTPLRSHTDGDGDVFMMLDLPLDRDISSDGTPANRSPHKSISPPVPGSPSLRGLQVSPRGGALVTSPPPLPQSPPSSHPSSPVVPARLTPTLSSPLHGAETLSLNQHTTQRLLTRSRTVCGSTGTRGRGSLRKTGLPLGDPPPPGDNIYEWLHASEKLPPLRPYNSEMSTHSSAAGDKYYGGDYGGLSLVGGGADSVSDTYVKFDIKDQDPQYHYPNLDSLANVLPSGDKNTRRGSLSSLKRQTNPGLGLEETFTPQDKAKGKKKDKGKKKQKRNGMRVRCAHCQDTYTESENKRGSCSYSPDAVRQGIECVSCLACAKCLLYHCHYEDENFSEEEICTCTDTDGHLTQRWIGLSLLAVLVPCLCLYPVLTTCYTCARACHVCGGKHVPV